MRPAYDRKQNSSDGILHAAVKADMRLTRHQKPRSQIGGGAQRI